MQQNASRDSWTAAHTEERLSEIMAGVHQRCAEAADNYGAPGDYVLGANISGFVRVADAMLALGGRVIAASDSSGYVHDTAGMDVELLREVKEIDRERISVYADRRGASARFVADRPVWEVPCQVALPCATHNELTAKDAADLIENGVRAVAEGANMPCTPEAIRAFRAAGVLFGPGKAANAGGVATSALEMQQNASRDSWTFEHSEQRLREIVRELHHAIRDTAEEYGLGGDYVAGANITGFVRVADAMLAHGLI
jgi:glutamate dehydrogenase (NADP+)